MKFRPATSPCSPRSRWPVATARSERARRWSPGATDARGHRRPTAHQPVRFGCRRRRHNRPQPAPVLAMPPPRSRRSASCATALPAGRRPDRGRKSPQRRMPATSSPSPTSARSPAQLTGYPGVRLLRSGGKLGPRRPRAATSAAFGPAGRPRCWSRPGKATALLEGVQIDLAGRGCGPSSRLLMTPPAGARPPRPPPASASARRADPPGGGRQHRQRGLRTARAQASSPVGR